MAYIFHPPPPPFVGGRQPYAARDTVPVPASAVAVNNPPFAHPGRSPVSSEIVTIWQPNPWTYSYFGKGQPFQPNALAPSLLDVPVNNPPVGNPRRAVEIGNIAAQTQPNPWIYLFQRGWQPYQPGRVPAESGAIPIDSPPPSTFGRSAIASELLTLWQPNPWVYLFHGRGQPFEPRKLPPSVLDVRVDNPPFTLASMLDTSDIITAAWQPPPPNAYFGKGQALEPRKLNPTVLNVVINDPPPRGPRQDANMLTIYAAWQQPAPLPTLALHSTGSAEVFAYVFGIVVV